MHDSQIEQDEDPREGKIYMLEDKMQEMRKEIMKLLGIENSSLAEDILACVAFAYFEEEKAAQRLLEGISELEAAALSDDLPTFEYEWDRFNEPSYD